MKTLKLFYLCLFGFTAGTVFSQTTLVATGSSWKYLDNGSNQGTAWRAAVFTETGWLQGNAQLGYGDGDEATVVSYGSSSSNKYVTTYFRKTFAVANANSFINYTLKVKRDDGVAVYVNGTEVYRNNLAANATSATLATLASDDGAGFQSTTLPAGTFVTGNNTIAVEIHQNAGNSSDISFDLELIGNLTAPVVTSQKHIHWGSSKNPLDGLTITWRNTGTADKIKWGYTNTYEQGTFNGVSRAGYADKYFNYSFPVVTPNATIYYELYDSQNNIWTGQKTYQTAPPLNTSDFTFLAIGDSRSNVGVWQTISNLAQSKNPDFVLFNGDIVENGNTNAQWDNWFDYGKNLIDKQLFFHAQGNHDVSSAANYQNIFELPKYSPTGTELYYAVEYGDAIFICLNTETPTNAAQRTWLTNTLAANVNKRWKIISFHKPFYTVGPHANEMNSEFGTWWKAFDDYGVDLILTGHDHLYERFKPINRNVSTTNAVATYGSGPTEGRCEVVCGGAGAPLYDAGTSGLLQTFKKDYHFVKFDVTATSLCGTVYDDSNVVIDNFCINKTNLGKGDPKNIFYPIKLSPNPVKESFKVTYSSPNTGKVLISIFDIKGNLVAQENTTKPETEFVYKYDASSLKQGVYVFEIQMDNQKDSAILIRE
ncbi:metallophosphoesterase [Flavobacterium humi]|uniref:T9SS type A sorting domain-containing protein n=1 Tax=Flavobacterium humi TaxID=2562683 RepID=A0A4Z0LCN0_9FLAO|nr:metallophosphoesterase [Flavobacterium humi]TGD59640.1 T9SS type A sorting domain-containing protein [Flavobacterium humi]